MDFSKINLKPSRPTLCLGLVNDYAARDFLDSGVLEELTQHFRLSFVSGAKLTLDLARFGPVHRYSDPSPLRVRIQQLARGLWHMHDKAPFDFNWTHAVAVATFGAGPWTTRLIRWISAIGLSWPAAIALRAWLRGSVVESLPEEPAPDAVLVYTSVNSSFADDLVREARRKRIPLLALTNNWDNINTKCFLEKPAYLGVWSEQGFLIARLMHRFFPHQLFLIGSPRFEIYRKFSVTREQARQALGVPVGARVLLFCGSGVAFEENSLLQELEASIQDGRLPADVHVMYKPHPLRFVRAAEKDIRFEELKHVTLIESKRGLTELELYPYLMACADALISPFSTMVMEGAHHGRPALCLGYNDPGHANHDWDRVAYNVHLYVIRHADWVVVCDRREQFVEKCRELLGMIGNKALSLEAVKAASMVFHQGERTVAEVIAKAIQRLMQGLDADDSYVASKRSLLSGRRAPLESAGSEK